MFVNAINYLILLPLTVFRFSQRMLIRWWPSRLLHHVICSFRRFGWPCCLHLHKTETGSGGSFSNFLRNAGTNAVCRIKRTRPLFEHCHGLYLLQRRWRRVCSGRCHQQQDRQQQGVKQASAPATDGFLAKFSRVAGAPTQPDACDSQQDSTHCWENRLAVDPTHPFHYRVSTQCGSVCLNISSSRVTLKYIPSSESHTISHTHSCTCVLLSVHTSSMSTSFTLLYVLHAHNASSGPAAGTNLLYSESHGVKFVLQGGKPDEGIVVVFLSASKQMPVYVKPG